MTHAMLDVAPNAAIVQVDAVAFDPWSDVGPESAHHALGLKPPWDHRTVRDVRTVRYLAERLTPWRRPTEETAHDALADAVAQARWVRDAHRALAQRPSSNPTGERTDAGG